MAGGTSNMGTLFRFQRDGWQYATLMSFDGAGGTTPNFALALSTDGVLFGTTYSGGQSNLGTVFKFRTNGTGFQVLHHFTGGSDSKNPSGPLIEGRDGALYGMTSYGNSTTRGTIYKVNKDGSAYTIIHNFTGSPDGQQPQGRLLQTSSGAIYGTTFFGGSSTQPGVAFCLNPDGTGYWLLHVFGGTGDGRGPSCGLTEASNGLLYGVTGQGGSASSGTIFRMDRYGGSYVVLRSFLGTPGDGKGPNSELVEGTDGSLYGTTGQGGLYGAGTIFKIGKDGSGYALLHHFSSASTEPTTPYGLIRARDGIIYGTTQYGGGGGAGCIYTLTAFPLPARILSLSIGADSTSLRCATTSGIQYDVERSTTLTSWSLLATLTSPGNGEILYTNLNQGVPTAFYRLRQN